MSGISHSVPDIINVPVDKLLALRKKEGDSFDVYRDKLSKVLKQSEKLKTEEIIELIDDEIKPQLRVIERTIKNARKLLVTSLFREIVVSSAYVGVGVFSGFLSPKVSELVTTLGGLSFARTLIEQSVKVLSVPESVIANPYYFLWKTTKK